MAKYASWIPGNSVLIEKRNAYQAIDKLSTYKITGPTFPDNEVGPIGDWAAFACFRLGWAARFVVFDTHPESDDPRVG